MTHPTTQYAHDVIAGKIVAGPNVRDACARHVKDLARTDVVFDEARANKAIRFFQELLVLRDGHRFRLLPWQVFVIGCIYGWMGDDGFRRFRRAYIETAKGSGKSPLIAGMALMGLIADGQARPEVFLLARDLHQSRIVFDFAKDMVEASPLLRKKVKVYGGANASRLLRTDGKGFLARMAHKKAGAGASGFNTSLVVLDEMHEVDDIAQFDLLVAGFKQRPEPLALVITNSGRDLSGPCYMEHLKACDVASGEVILDSYFSYVCSMDTDDDPWENEKCWPKTNPGLPQLPGNRYIRNMCEEARGSPTERARVSRLLFCQWSGAATPFLTQEQWEAVQVDELSPIEERVGKRLSLGVDLSLLRDLTAVALVWDMESHLEAEVVSFVPGSDLVDKEVADGLPYREWIEEGHIEHCNGYKVRISDVARCVLDAHETFGVDAVGYDVYRITELMDACEDGGMAINRNRPGSDVYWIQHGQSPGQWLRPDDHGKKGLNMSISIDHFEDAVIDKKIRVKRNPVLTQAIMRGRIYHDGKGNRAWTKLNSRARDDPAVSLCMGIGTAITKPTGDMTDMEAYYANLRLGRDK